MVNYLALFSLCASVSLSTAVPLNKRIAQTIADSTAQWEQACVRPTHPRPQFSTQLLMSGQQLAAGGAQQCNPISQQAFTSLLAAGGNCDQQDAADSMIDLAKQLNNDADMIRLAQIFVQQPRNAVRSPQQALHYIVILTTIPSPIAFKCHIAKRRRRTQSSMVSSIASSQDRTSQSSAVTRQAISRLASPP